MTAPLRHFLQLADLSGDELQHVFERTRPSRAAAASTACRSLYGTRMKPEGSGSKPLRAFSEPVAASVASVRPCQARSITTV